MEKIVVSREIKTSENIQLEIQDIRNCYLKGQDCRNNVKNYLGIWTDKKGLKIVSIFNQSAISVDYSKNPSVGTRVDIECFLKHNNRVVEISKEEFRKELSNILDLLDEVRV